MPLLYHVCLKALISAHRQRPLAAHHLHRHSGDRFMNAAEINDLFEQESPAERPHVKLLSLLIKRE
jgi:hypothetical protein